MKRIFPSAGTFNQTEFEKVIDVTNRNNIYKTVVDAETKVNSADKVKLAATMDDAMKRIDTVMADAAGRALDHVQCVPLPDACRTAPTCACVTKYLAATHCDDGVPVRIDDYPR